ncbi:MAG: hypothetical protein D6820_05735 [Lentisphaerae bacterium]|nr:MAG: hypothetical protein D6820_05735 [Lentisphaerota bacterium]
MGHERLWHERALWITGFMDWGLWHGRCYWIQRRENIRFLCRTLLHNDGSTTTEDLIAIHRRE